MILKFANYAYVKSADRIQHVQSMILLGTDISGDPVTGASQIPSNAFGAVGGLATCQI